MFFASEDWHCLWVRPRLHVLRNNVNEDAIVGQQWERDNNAQQLSRISRMAKIQTKTSDDISITRYL